MMFRRMLYVTLAALALVSASSGLANATGETTGRAASYINPDIGAVTENPNVNPNSDCLTPDRNDAQEVSPAGTTTNNVHNDACFLQNGEQVNGPASFQSFGVGSISACPDPDGAGPEFAVLSDTNGDGQTDLCYQSAYQTGKGAGDTEYHARMNSVVAGRQLVVFCSDADADGCRDERNSAIIISWRR